MISYQYSTYTSQRIELAAVQDIQVTAQVQAHDTSGFLVGELQAIANNLEIIAASPQVQAHNTTAAAALFNAAQNSSKKLTAEYFWDTGNGDLILLSNGTSLSVASYAGQNYTQRAYFTGAKEAGAAYYSSATQSLINTSLSHVFVSYPVYVDQSAGGYASREFEGVVGAAIDLSSLGDFIKGELSTSTGSSIGMVDPTGVILYSGNSSDIGLNIFGPEIQSELPQYLKAPLDSILNKSLLGQSGVSEISVSGSNITVAYQPVFITGSDGSAARQFGVIYLVTPDVLAGSDAALISQERVLGLFLIVGIAGLSAAAGVILLGWNRRLDDTVKTRTADLVAANERLSAYAKAQTDFVNIAAHELRTPTQSIVGYAEILEGASPSTVMGVSPTSTSASAGKVEESDVRLAVDSIFRNAKRLKKLTDDILSASRIETNTLTLSRETFDLNALVKDAIREIEDLGAVKDDSSDKNRIEVTFHPESPELLLDADASKISEVISNLLSNAEKFSGPGGRVSVSTEKKGDEVLVTVKDNGAGISSEIMPNLFSKFATNSSSGTGLGLFISKKVVEAHGGRMWARNNDNGGGSSFYFTLPLHPQVKHGMDSGS